MIKSEVLPNYLMIKVSNVYGLTIFATKKIPNGHVIATTYMSNMDVADGCIGTPMGDVFNHSDTDYNAIIRINPKVNLKIDVVAITDIDKGDEILVNYETNQQS